MTRKWTRRQTLAAGVGLCIGSRLPAAPPKLEAFTGKVRPLADLVRQVSAKLDPDAAPHWLALVTDDGKIYPLIKDDGARVFFADKEVLDRPMRVHGRFLPGSQLLQVIEVQSVKKGVVHDLYYWCDICSIRRRSKMICECCGGPMELKEEAVKK
jgi:hypothetical protein